jgi:hypothetical protein
VLARLIQLPTRDASRAARAWRSQPSGARSGSTIVSGAHASAPSRRASVDETARLWDARTGELLRIFPSASETAALSPDGATLYNEAESAWRLEDGRLVRRVIAA